jgi:hypothetical protein
MIVYNKEEFHPTGVGSINATTDKKKIIYTDLVGAGGLVLLTSDSPINVVLNPAGEWKFTE